MQNKMTEEKPLSTSDRTIEVKIRMGASGVGAKPPTTVMENFRETVKKQGNALALHQKVLKEGIPADETPWSHWTWHEYYTNVLSFAKSLLSLGFNQHDTINIIGFNSPEWFFSNFGAIAAGGIPAGVYTTNLPDACKYISSHSEAKVVVVEGNKQLDKYLEIASDLPMLKAIVMYGPEEVPAAAQEKCAVPVYGFDAFMQLGNNIQDSEVEKRMDASKPGEVCTLIYTSGTTGNPKAVMITNDNLTWTTNVTLSCLPNPVGNDDHMVSYLPLSHIAAQMLDMHCGVHTGMQVWFAQPDALRGSLGKALKEVRPTIFFGVPRVWEKIYDKMQEVAKTTKGLKKTISTWAKNKAAAKNKARQFGSTKSGPLSYTLARKILRKVHIALGLDRCTACFTAAAPIEVKVLEYFASIDLPIYEIFGQSECTGPHTINQRKAWKIGTCGRPLPGTESKLDEDNGELCYRGRHIFAGYMNMPEKTVEAIDGEGWLHSGDVAKFDDCNDTLIPKGPSGFMSITGRIKELIITAGGENIPPVLIEDEFKDAMPALSNCMVVGDKRNFLSILLCLQVEIDAEGISSDKLTGEALATSKALGSNATTSSEAMKCEKWTKYFDEGMEKANGRATSRAQKVAKWTLLAHDFSEKAGELTPTLKLKRSVAADIHSAEIEAMYA